MEPERFDINSMADFYYFIDVMCEAAALQYGHDAIDFISNILRLLVRDVNDWRRVMNTLTEISGSWGHGNGDRAEETV